MLWLERSHIPTVMRHSTSNMFSCASPPHACVCMCAGVIIHCSETSSPLIYQPSMSRTCCKVHVSAAHTRY